MLRTRSTFLLTALTAFAAVAVAAGCGDAAKSTDAGEAPGPGESTTARVEDAVKDSVEAAGAAAEKGLEKAGELATDAREVANEAGAVAKETGEEVAETTREKVHDLAQDIADATKPVVDATLPLAAAFSLPDTDGKTHALADYRGKYVVLEWISHGCPYVKKHYGSGNMQALQKKYREKGVVWLSICSSGEGKEGYYTAADWKAVIEEHGNAPTAVLLDPSGQVGRLYKAKTTPHMFVIGPKGEVLYQGAIDDAPSADPKTIATAKNYVASTLDAAMAGEPVPVAKTKPYG